MTTALDLNRRLATLLGWTNIIDTGGALLGTPTEGEPQCRGQARVPDWVGDWRDCGPLMVRHHAFVHSIPTYPLAPFVPFSTPCGRGAAHAWLAGEDDPERTVREAIVSAVIAKLEARQ